MVQREISEPISLLQGEGQINQAQILTQAGRAKSLGFDSLVVYQVTGSSPGFIALGVKGPFEAIRDQHTQTGKELPLIIAGVSDNNHPSLNQVSQRQVGAFNLAEAIAPQLNRVGMSPNAKSVVGLGAENSLLENRAAAAPQKLAVPV